MLKRNLATCFGAVALLVLSACGGGGGSSSSSGSPAALQPTWVINGAGGPGATGALAGGATGSGTGAASGSGSASNSELAGISEAYAKVKSYKATYTVEASGAKQEGRMDVVLPDKFHLTFAAPGAAGAGNVEMILIGADTYFKAGPSWIKQPAAPGATTQGFDPKQIESTVKEWRGAGSTKGGTATVSGKTCQIYNVSSSAGNQEVCIADNLPYRVVTQTGSTKMTIIFSDYNGNLEIKAPI